MLIRFSCPAHHDVIMFGHIAEELIHMMGFSGRIPSAVEPEDIAAAKARLEKALSAMPEPPPPPSEEGAEEDGRDHVPLHSRALPLLEMLNTAIQRNSYVMWEETH